MIMTAMMWNMAKAEEHFVGGGKQGWIPGNNLTKWSLNEHFRVNDWLCKFSPFVSSFSLNFSSSSVFYLFHYLWWQIKLRNPLDKIVLLFLYGLATDLRASYIAFTRGF